MIYICVDENARDFDVAVMKLFPKDFTKPDGETGYRGITWGDYAAPACLPTAPPPARSYCKIAGWGQILGNNI